MGLSGAEKRIQALFSDLSLEDQSSAPCFEKLWRQAAANAPVRAQVTNRSMVVILAAMVVAAASSLATWSWYGSSQSQYTVSVPPPAIPLTPVAIVNEPGKFLSESKSLRTVRPRRVMRQRQTERVATREAATLSNWQSPTNILLESPVVSVLTSLPKLNQSARDLEMFLPKTNELMKESKQ